MNGRRIVRKTTRTLCKTVFFLLLFIAVGFITYKLTITYYKSTGKYASASAEDTKAIAEATTDTVAVNAIFAVDGDKGLVTKLVLEIFHSDTGKLDFVTIPTSSEYLMSKDLFATMSKENSNIPQIIGFEDLPNYFSQIMAYQYGCLVLEESLGINVSFYTLMPESLFEEYFEKADVNSETSNGSSQAYTLNTTTVHQLEDLDTSLQMEAELATYYTKVQSNLSLSKRNAYLSAYQKADYANIGVYSLKMNKETNQLDELDQAWIAGIVRQ